MTSLVVIISVKNSHLCSSGLAKYKISKEITQTIKFKYFFPANQLSQTFATGDLVFISAGPSNNTKKYHTTIEDYIEDDNESDNKKGIDLIYDEDLQDFEEQEELQPRKRRKPLKKATKGKQKAT
ncbi:hypothetical protein C2G38_2148558 [Gigaspora rosea]|uniref:Uncharacterized protein n=1 Tax=Gigaspora rosea TaxID=44941 RepID=A0A397U5B9_9GLOM|nr:hypothetical protein C2G38_2148558 [Gigaspora rosea]